MARLMTTTFFSALGLGTTLVFASTHWLMAWIGLEINTLAILPIMVFMHQPRSIEAAIKYFLVQATGTAILFFAVICNSWGMKGWNVVEIEGMPVVLVVLGLVLKMGLAPFHHWFAEVLQGCDLGTGLILSTWQKLAPLALLMQVACNVAPFLLMTLGALSTLLAGWAGMNHSQMRKIMAYSSTAHLGWMVVIIQYAPYLALLTMGIYVLSTMAAFLTLKETFTTKISQFTQSWSKNPAVTTNIIFILLSLAGLPPLSGFMPKWLILEQLMKQGMSATGTLIALSALLSLYFYIRLCYTTTLCLFPNRTKTKMEWRTTIKTRSKIPLATVSTLTIILLPLTPFVTALTYYHFF